MKPLHSFYGTPPPEIADTYYAHRALQDAQTAVDGAPDAAAAEAEQLVGRAYLRSRMDLVRRIVRLLDNGWVPDAFRDE